MAFKKPKADQADPILQEINELKERMLNYAAEQKRLGAELQENMMRMKNLLAQSRQNTQQTRQQARIVMGVVEESPRHATNQYKHPYSDNYKSKTASDDS